MSEEQEAKGPARKNPVMGLALCSFICLALVAAPIYYCSLSSGNKKMTNEEVVLNWMEKYRKGQNIKTMKAEPAKTKKAAETATIREDQIKAVDKMKDGWVVITNENRLLFVPRTDD
jgi:hypothetical protein